MEIVANYKPVLKNEVPVYREPMTKLFKNKKVFVLGYGSLLYADGWQYRGIRQPPEAKDLTECDVKGFKRGPFGIFGISNYYGGIRSSSDGLNGVVLRINDLTDWVSLMSTELIAGLHMGVNYRVVDVTENIQGIWTPDKDSVVHMVCNRPRNRSYCTNTYPGTGMMSGGYYDRVWKGIASERTPEFAKKFLETGGFKSNIQVEEYLQRLKDKNTKRG